MQTILRKILLLNSLLVLLFLFSGCWTWKRSDCPTYRDSDPNVIFGGGDETFAQDLKKQEEKYEVKPKSRNKLLRDGKKKRKKAKKAKRKRRKN